jgi:hypothetical protein
MSDYPRLPRSDVMLIQSLFNTRYRERNVPPGGMAELWYQVISDFLETKNNARLNREYTVMEQGKSKEYIAALLEIVAPADGMSEHDKVMLMLTASPEDKEAALRNVFF